MDDLAAILIFASMVLGVTWVVFLVKRDKRAKVAGWSALACFVLSMPVWAVYTEYIETPEHKQAREQEAAQRQAEKETRRAEKAKKQQEAREQREAQRLEKQRAQLEPEDQRLARERAQIRAEKEDLQKQRQGQYDAPRQRQQATEAARGGVAKHDEFSAQDRAVVASIPLDVKQEIYAHTYFVMNAALVKFHQDYPVRCPGYDRKELEYLVGAKDVVADQFGLTFDQVTLIWNEGWLRAWPQSYAARDPLPDWRP